MTTYKLNNSQKEEMLRSNGIKFWTTPNTIFVNGQDLTNASDQEFKAWLN